MQFSVRWDTEIAEFVSFGTEALPFIAVGDQDAAAGVLRVSWFNQMNTFTTLPDSSRILRIRLRAVGEPGQQTEIEFTNAPLAIQLFRQGDEPNTFDPVALIARPCELRIPAPFSTTVAAQNETCAGAADGAITLSTTADTTQFTFTWTGENGTVYPGTMPRRPAGRHLHPGGHRPRRQRAVHHHRYRRRRGRAARPGTPPALPPTVARPNPPAPSRPRRRAGARPIPTNSRARLPPPAPSAASWRATTNSGSPMPSAAPSPKPSA